MSIADIGKKKEEGKSAGESPLKQLRLPRISINHDQLVWILLGVVAVFEIFLLYRYVYTNVIFDKLDPNDPGAQSVVRINFEQYNKVIKRLDGLPAFFISEPVEIEPEFGGPGRTNPFAEPE